jgi:hypothetical protein
MILWCMSYGLNHSHGQSRLKRTNNNADKILENIAVRTKDEDPNVPMQTWKRSESPAALKRVVLRSIACLEKSMPALNIQDTPPT